jgi:hypothetical protein
MNWTKASAIAEILSSVAILITLVYLVVEIQQNAEATQSDTRQEILASDQQYLGNYLDSPELMALQYQAELSDDERVRVSILLTTFVRMRENNWLQYENGTLDDATWRAYQGSIVATFAAPQARAWWQNFGVERVFDPEFLSVVDELLANGTLFDRSPHITAFD